ncbi:hypothetical protein [Streptomyces sp. NPDC057748]|uniref:hypothetical protein n=1 Tax=unclassified Streptomyces TaxID=2593676 RepID=UPI00368689F4
MVPFGFAGLPVPAGGDAPAIDAIIAAYSEVLDKHLLQLVTTEADRNAKLNGCPNGTVAVSTTTGTVWARAGGTWVTWWEPIPAWRTLALSSTYVAQEIIPQIRRVGKKVTIRGRVARADGGLIDARNGVKVADVPTDCRPAVLSTGAGGQSLAGDPMIGLCRVEVFGADTSTSLGGVGTVALYTQDGLTTGAGTSWLGLDIEYWTD